MRLGMVTWNGHLPWHPDDAPLVAALGDSGIEVVSAAWDAQLDWAAFDLVLIRTPWDYFQRFAQFRGWLDALERCNARVVNPVRTLRWNADKRYLMELAAAAIPVVPTVLIERGDSGGTGLAQAMAKLGAAEVVVKPAVSGGAWRTLRVTATAAPAHTAEIAQWRSQGELLVQPFLPAIASAGEWWLIFFGGRFSHQVLKSPRAGDFRVQEEHGGTREQRPPHAALLAAAQRCVDALPALGHEACLYARVDGVEVEGSFLLMELELIEPQLFFTEVPGAATRFAEVIATESRQPRTKTV